MLPSGRGAAHPLVIRGHAPTPAPAPAPGPQSAPPPP